MQVILFRLVFSCVLLSTLSPQARAEAPRGAEQSWGTGLLPHSPEQSEFIRRHLPRVKKVRPNRLGLERLNDHRRRRGQRALPDAPAEPSEEITTTTGDTEILGASAAPALPPSINNASPGGPSY